MADEEKGTKKTYVCDRFPELILVKKSQRRTIVDGEVVNHPPEHILFKPTGLGGEFVSEDTAEQKFIEGHEFFKQGVIVLADSENKPAGRRREVVQGAVGSGAREPEVETEKPKENAQEVKAMKTPGRRGPKKDKTAA